MSLSSAQKWSRWDDNFDTKAIFNSIVKIFEKDPNDPWVIETLQYINEQVHLPTFQPPLTLFHRQVPDLDRPSKKRRKASRQGHNSSSESDDDFSNAIFAQWKAKKREDDAGVDNELDAMDTDDDPANNDGGNSYDNNNNAADSQAPPRPQTQGHNSSGRSGNKQVVRFRQNTQVSSGHDGPRPQDDELDLGDNRQHSRKDDGNGQHSPNANKQHHHQQPQHPRDKMQDRRQQDIRDDSGDQEPQPQRDNSPERRQGENCRKSQGHQKREPLVQHNDGRAPKRQEHPHTDGKPKDSCNDDDNERPHCLNGAAAQAQPTGPGGARVGSCKAKRVLEEVEGRAVSLSFILYDWPLTNRLLRFHDLLRRNGLHNLGHDQHL